MRKWHVECPNCGYDSRIIDWTSDFGWRFTCYYCKQELSFAELLEGLLHHLDAFPDGPHVREDDPAVGADSPPRQSP